MDKTAKNLVVFGGAGFIGTNICLEAVAKGHKVFAFDSLVRKGVESNIGVLENAGVELIRGDVRNPEDFWRLPDHIDGVFMMAANPGIPWSIENPLFDFNTNTGGVVNVLELSRKNGKFPVIFASTNKTYSDIINEIPVKEEETRYVWDDQFHFDGWSWRGVQEQFTTEGYGEYPHSPYGVSKLSADHYCQEYFHTYGIPTVVNRMSCIYGYYQQGCPDQGWVDGFIREMFQENPHIDIFGDGKQVRDMLWGGDVAKLYVKEFEEIDQVKGEVFNVGGGYSNTLSLKEAIAEIQKLSGKEFSIDYHDWRHADQKIYISDILKVSEALNWKPTVSPQDGIKAMYDRYAATLKA